jgi:hypothetical protein
MNDLGFFAITLENIQLHEKLCDTLGSYIKNHPKQHIVLFNQYSEKIDTKNIPILPLSHSKYFDGSLVVFDIQSLLIAEGSIKCKNLYFYAQNIPWQISYSHYSDWKNIMKHDKLKVIANSTYLHEIYNMVWNNSIGICEDINYEQFSKFVQ